MRLERRHVLWLPIGLLHALLLQAYLPQPPAASAPPERSVVVHLLPAPRRATQALPPKPLPSAWPERRQTPTTPLQPPPAEGTEPVTPTGELPPSPPAAETANAGPAPLPLLQTDATRQAIRLAARTPLLSERAASASEAPARETAQQRFGREVARTAHGNCLKGEFPGAGAGLLSLPMFLIAEASGRCQK